MSKLKPNICQLDKYKRATLIIKIRLTHTAAKSDSMLCMREAQQNNFEIFAITHTHSYVGSGIERLCLLIYKKSNLCLPS